VVDLVNLQFLTVQADVPLLDEIQKSMSDAGPGFTWTCKV
jgi:hypothetical protein